MLAILGAAVGAHWIAHRPYFDHWGRVPAVTLGALIVAILATATLVRADEEVEGSTPRPSPTTELLTVLAIVLISAVIGIVAIPAQPLERGGLELARNLIGLTGLALIGSSIAGSRLGWLLPFTVTALSYFTVTPTYDNDPHQAILGWLMFPATWTITFVIAGILLLAGLIAWPIAGTTPRPRHHPLR